MKVLILAGGLGTRLSEETELKPKPMVEIGGYPILWHIMKIYAASGFREFIVLGGYKVGVIKDYFINYYYRNSDITVDLSDNSIEIHRRQEEDWRVTILDTGLNTMTGGRISRARNLIGGERFMLTYGDGVSDVDLRKLLDCHVCSGRTATMTAVMPDGRFGALDIDSGGAVNSFREKPKGDGAWINGGFFVCEPAVFDYIIPGDDTVIFERDPLENMAQAGVLGAYRHRGFWRPMDTLRDKNELNALWASGRAPWKTWSDA